MNAPACPPPSEIRGSYYTTCPPPSEIRGSYDTLASKSCTCALLFHSHRNHKRLAPSLLPSRNLSAKKLKEISQEPRIQLQRSDDRISFFLTFFFQGEYL